MRAYAPRRSCVLITAEFIDERRKLLDAWARFVAPMATKCKTATVVPFNKRAR